MTRQLTFQDLTVAVLPGGPGLSGGTLKELQALGKQTNVLFVEPEGNGEDWSYEAILARVVDRLQEMPNIILCGHSFGGVLAAEIACNGVLDLKGLILMGAPFSSSARESIRNQFSLHMTPELRAAGEAFSAEPGNETFRKWLYWYRDLYFSPRFIEAGSKMLASDNVEHRAYLGAAKAGADKEHLLPLLKSLRIPKLFLAGEQDQLFCVDVALQEAGNGGFEFRRVKDAGHFMAFEQPNEVLSEIHSFLNTIVAQRNTEGV